MSKHFLTPRGLWTWRSERHMHYVYVAIKVNTYCIIGSTDWHKEVSIVYLCFVGHNLLVAVLLVFSNVLLILFFLL
jgi:hypothetical protein